MTQRRLLKHAPSAAHRERLCPAHQFPLPIRHEEHPVAFLATVYQCRSVKQNPAENKKRQRREEGKTI